MRKLLLSAVIILSFLVPASCLGRDSESLTQASDHEDGCIQMCVTKCLEDLQKEADTEAGKCVNSAEFIEDIIQIRDGFIRFLRQVLQQTAGQILLGEPQVQIRFRLRFRFRL